MPATAELISVERPPHQLPSAIRCLIRTRIESEQSAVLFYRTRSLRASRDRRRVNAM